MKTWRWHFPFNFYVTLRGTFYYSHFTDEKTEVRELTWLKADEQ